MQTIDAARTSLNHSCVWRILSSFNATVTRIAPPSSNSIWIALASNWKQFWTDDQKNYSLWRNPAWDSFTEDDLIVINAGIHYALKDADQLYEIGEFIRNRSKSTKATIVVIETNDQQFPTSNGIFTEACKTRRCPCEALTPLRLQGRDFPLDRGPNHIQFDTDPSDSTLPRRVAELYPNHRPPTLQNTSIAHCIPDCAPPMWRNDLIRIPLQQQGSRVHIVPVWRQLVKHGKMHSKGRGDCTHVTVEALLMTNQQLVRTLQKAQQ